MSKLSLYKRLAVFRDEGPGRFAGKNSETSGWVKATSDGLAAAKAVVPALSVVGRAAPNRPRGAGIQGPEERENSERFIVLRACFDARRCFRGGRVRCCLGVCVARCECRCRAYACDERERKGDREHCGRGLFHVVDLSYGWRRFRDAWVSVVV